MAKVNEVAPSLSEPCQLLGSRTPLELVAISNVKLNNEIFSSRSLSIHKRILVKNFLTLLYQLNPIEWIEESPVDEQDGWMEQTLNAAGLGDSGDNSHNSHTTSSAHAGSMSNQPAHEPRTSSLPADTRRNNAKRRSFSAGAPSLPPFPFSGSSSQSSNGLSSSADRPSVQRPTSTELPQSLHSYLAAVFDVNWSVDLPNHEDSWFTQPSASGTAFTSSSSGLNDQQHTRSLLSSSSTDTARDSRQESALDSVLMRSASRGHNSQADPNLKHVVPLTRKSSLQYGGHSAEQQQQQQSQDTQRQQLSQQTQHQTSTAVTQQQQSQSPSNRAAQTRIKPTLVPGRRSSLMHSGSYPPPLPQKSPEAKAVDTASSQSLTVASNVNSNGKTPTPPPTLPAKSPTGPTPVYSRRTSSLPNERTKVSPRMPNNDRAAEPTVVDQNLPFPPSGLPRPLVAPSAPAVPTTNASGGSRTSLSAKTRRQISGELELKAGQGQQPPSSPPQQCNQTHGRGAATLTPQAPRQFTISSPPSSPSLEEDSSPIFSPTPTFHLSSSKGLLPSLPSPSPSPPLLLPHNANEPLQLSYDGVTNHSTTSHLVRPYTFTRSTSDDDIFQSSRPARLAEPQKTYLPSSKSSPSLVTDSGLSDERPLPPLPSHVQSNIRPSLIEYHQYYELQKQFVTDDRQSQQQQEHSGSLVSTLGLGKLLTRSNSKSMSISAPFMLSDKETGKPIFVGGTMAPSSPPMGPASTTAVATTGKSRGRNAVSMLKGTLSSVKSGLVRSSSQILPSATTVAAAAVVMNSSTAQTGNLSPPSISRYSHQPPQILGGPSTGTLSSLSTASYSSTSSTNSSSSTSSSSASPPLTPSTTMTSLTSYSGSSSVQLQQHQSYQHQPTSGGRSARDTEKATSIYSTITTSSTYSSFPQPPAPTHFSPHGGAHAYAGMAGTGMTATPATVSLATGGHESSSSSPVSSSSGSPRWNSMKSMFGLRVASQEAS